MAAIFMRCARGVIVSGARSWHCRQQLTKLVSATPHHRCFSATTRIFAERLLSTDHEWVVMEGNVGTVGISDHAQDALGDIVYVECPAVDTVIEKGDAVATVESVKAVTEVFTPVSGKVIAMNETLSDKPNKVNTSCYNEGWLYKVELSDMSELKSLMNEEQYKKFLETME